MLRRFIPRWAFLLLLMCAGLVIGLRTSVGFFIFLFWFLLLSSALGLVWLALTVLSSRLSLAGDRLANAVEDERVTLTIRMRNDGPLPLCNLLVRCELPFAPPELRLRSFLVDCLGPGSSLPMQLETVCYKRGRFEIGTCAVYFFDPFGIFFLRRKLPVYAQLYVYPRLFPVRSFPPLIKGALPWFGIDTVKSGGDDDEFYGTREYRFGDPIRTVHWVSTARKNKLIVKQFQRQSYYRATILFNLMRDANYGEGKETVCEYTIRIAGSIARYLLAANVSVEMICHAGEIVHIAPNKGQEHLDEIMKFLTVAMPESGVGLGEIVQEFASFIPDDSNLIVIMPDTEWESFLSSVMADTRGLTFVPVILVSSSFLGAYDGAGAARELKVKLYRQFGRNPVVVSCGDSLEDIFEEF